MSTTQRTTADPVSMKTGEQLRIGVDFTLYGLDDSELLVSTIVTPPTGLTESGAAVNVATFLNRRKRTVAVGKGVVFLLTAVTAGVYTVPCEAVSNGSPAQTLIVDLPVEVRDSGTD